MKLEPLCSRWGQSRLAQLAALRRLTRRGANTRQVVRRQRQERPGWSHVPAADPPVWDLPVRSVRPIAEQQAGSVADSAPGTLGSNHSGGGLPRRSRRAQNSAVPDDLKFAPPCSNLQARNEARAGERDRPRGQRHRLRVEQGGQACLKALAPGASTALAAKISSTGMTWANEPLSWWTNT